MKLPIGICIFSVACSIAVSKVVTEPKYNAQDPTVQDNSNSVHDIVPVNGNSVVINLLKNKTSGKNDTSNRTLDNFIVKYKNILYLEKPGHRMVEIIYSQNDLGEEMMVDCFLIGEKAISKQLLLDIPAEDIKFLEKTAMTKLVGACSDFLLAEFKKGHLHQHSKKTISPESGLNRGLLDGLFIFPGTKWCGAGSVAHDYEDLGVSQDADRCCRTHDHCNDSISALGEKYGLRNRALYTASHCNCDRAFQECLFKANNFVSNTIGCVYYNLLQTKCFEMNYPIVGCNRHSGYIPLFHWSCQEYELDYNSNHIWQFFDAKKYSPPEDYLKLNLKKML